MLLRPTHEWWEWTPAFNRTDKIRSILLNFTLLRAYFEHFTVLGLPTAWSLTVEETFYICAPFLLVAAKGNVRRLIVFPLLLAVIGLCLVAICSRFLPIYGLMDSVRFMLNITFFGRATEFVMGMALGLWVAGQPRDTSPRATYTTLGIVGILSYMAVVAAFNHFYPVSGPQDWTYAQIVANNALLPIFVCSLLWGLLSERTKLRSLLETPLFDLLGKSSYVLYLIHLGTVDYLFRTYVLDYSPICLVVYVLASVAIYKLVEHPLHLRLRAGRRPRVVATTT